MQQTEVTVQLFDSFNSVIKKLTKQGFKLILKYRMIDWYFTKLDCVDNLSYSELMLNSFLVREVGKDVSIIYKNKTIDKNGNVLCEEKLSTPVIDLKSALSIFKNANLNNYCVVDNNSYVYKKGNVELVIQKIKGLGIFLELEENKSMRNLNLQEKIFKLINTVKNLNLKLGTDFSCKKVFMLLHK